MRIILMALAVLVGCGGAVANDEAAIRDVISRWYAELEARDKGRPWTVTAPGFIDASPWYDYPETKSAVLGRPFYTSLAARALRFAYDVTALRADDSFAKVNVWERGYFYAGAVERTYEMAASTTFVLERQQNGGWLILAHEANSSGIPSNKATDPMPDLRELYLQNRQGDSRH